jgi:cell cycle checkpoint protein
MKKALQALLSAHFASAKGSAPSKETLDIVIETSNGDIRSAIMALQFSCVVEAAAPSGKKGRGKNSKVSAAGSGGSKLVLEAVTRRESSLHLFHLIGRVLYNKRRSLYLRAHTFLWADWCYWRILGKGDPANPSATAKDIQKDRELDARLKDPTGLPEHLGAEARRTSRVDVDVRNLPYFFSAILHIMTIIYMTSCSTPTRRSTHRCSRSTSTRTTPRSAPRWRSAVGLRSG